MSNTLPRLLHEARALIARADEIEQIRSFPFHAGKLQRRTAKLAIELRNVKRTSLSRIECDEIDCALGPLVWMVASEEERKKLIWYDGVEALIKDAIGGCKTKAQRQPNEKRLRYVRFQRSLFWRGVLEPYREDPRKKRKRTAKSYFRAMKRLGLPVHKNACNAQDGN